MISRPRKLNTPTITAVLTQWRLSGRTVSGIIKDSTSSYFPNGAFMNVGINTISHFKKEDFPNMDEPDHWRIRDSSGRYFLIFEEDKWTDLGD